MLIMDLRNGNCFDLLKELKDDSIDLIITSPPYNMNLRIRNGKYCSRQIVKEISTKYEGYDDNLPMEEYFDMLDLLISESLRVSKMTFLNIQILTGNKPAIYSLMGKYAKNIKEMIIWDKCHAQPAIGKNVLNSRFELILVFSKEEDAISRFFKNAQFDRGTLENLWEIKKGRKIDSSHGAVFPEELIEKIVLNFSKENDIILDPMMGTGTTGVVSFKLKRNFIGFEMSEKYFNIAIERINSLKM